MSTYTDCISARERSKSAKLQKPMCIFFYGYFHFCRSWFFWYWCTGCKTLVTLIIQLWYQSCACRNIHSYFVFSSEVCRTSWSVKISPACSEVLYIFSRSHYDALQFELSFGRREPGSYEGGSDWLYYIGCVELQHYNIPEEGRPQLL